MRIVTAVYDDADGMYADGGCTASTGRSGKGLKNRLAAGIDSIEREIKEAGNLTYFSY